MQFQTDGQIFKVVRITGPTHNYLGLSFTKDESEEVTIEPLVINQKEPQMLDADSVHRWVMAGLRQVNQELGTQYHPRKIQFVTSDTPPADTYANLARAIVERLHMSPDAFNGTTG